MPPSEIRISVDLGASRLLFCKEYYISSIVLRDDI
jgi:hypothetical protein